MEHPDYTFLNLASEKISKVAEHLNETMRGIESAQKLVELQESFTTPLVRFFKRY